MGVIIYVGQISKSRIAGSKEMFIYNFHLKYNEIVLYRSLLIATLLRNVCFRTSSKNRFAFIY